MKTVTLFDVQLIIRTYIVVQIVVVIFVEIQQWIWRKLCFFVQCGCNGVATTCVYAHA